MTASNDATVATLDSFPQFNFPNSLFTTDVSFSSSLLDPWNIEAINDGDTEMFSTPDRTGAPEMPFTGKLAVTGSQENPVVNWQAPAGAPRVDRYRVQAWNDDTNAAVAQTAPLSASTTQTQFSGLDSNTNYSFRVIAEQTESPGDLSASLSGVVTRSSNWINRSVVNTSGTGSVAQLTTGSPVSLQQSVDTPAGSFTMSFDFAFLTDTGELTVTLDGTQIGIPLLGADFDSGFSTATFEVDDAALLDRNSILLEFGLNGPTGSSVLLDNVRFPGLLNANFEGGLTSWSSSGEGSVNIASVPEPPSIWTLSIAILTLAGFAAWRRHAGAARRLP